MPQVLRTSDDRFDNLPDFAFAPHYVQLDDTRLHYVDESQHNETILCLHGEPSWSFLYRHMLARFAAAGYRAIAPDLIGFGRSDKYADKDDYSFAMHMDKLRGFIGLLDLQHITLVVQDWGGLLGLTLVREMPERFARLVIMNTGLPTGEEAMPRAFLAWRRMSAQINDMPVGEVIQQGTVQHLPDDVLAAYDAPFPDARYKAGAHIFPSLVPISPEQEGATELKATRKFLQTWDKPTLVMFSDSDPITRGGAAFFRGLIPTASAQPDITIQGAGHFLQEDKGPEIAEHILAFVHATTQ
ncbi:MAG: haloalkane dehalogenase [Anaerolineales bacterium]